MAKSKTTKNAAARTAKTSRPGGKPTIPDVMRLGVGPATTLATMTPAQRRQAVNTAHKMGVTVGSALDPSVPQPLKQRTQTSLQAQSGRTIQEAFAPQKAELDYTERQAAGLRAKRLSDESAFNSWYAQQTSEMNARAQAAQQAYQDRATQQAAAQHTEADTRSAALAGQVQQGASGDMSNSVYLKDAQERERARAAQADLTANAAVKSGESAATQANARQAAVVGQHQADVAGVEGDYGKVISGVTADRLKLASDRAKAQISEYTRLLDQEVTKANAVQQYQGTMATLTQKASQQQQQNDQFYAGLSAADKKSRRSAAVAKQNAQLGADTSITVAGINATQKGLDRALKKAEGARNRATQLQIAAKAHPGTAGAPSDAEIKNSQAQVQVVHTIADIIRKYHSTFRDKNGRVVNTRSALISRGYSGSQIDGGLSLARYGRIKNPSLYKQLGILPQHRG